MKISASQINTAEFIRLGGFAAFGFAVLIVMSNAIAVPAGLPLTGADLDQVERFYGAKSHIVGISSLITPAAWVCATLFGAGTVAALRFSMEQNWSLVGFAGLISQNVTFAVIIAIRLGLTLVSHDRSAVTALLAVNDSLFSLNGTFLATALIGLSIGGLHVKLIQRWHAILGLISGGLLLLSATLTPLIIERAGHFGLIGLCGWLIWVIWIVFYGFALFRFSRILKVGLG